jgi:hypothetical protein
MNRLKKVVLAIGLGILAMGAQANVVSNGSFQAGLQYWDKGTGFETVLGGAALLETLSWGEHESIRQVLTLGWGDYVLKFSSQGSGFGTVFLDNLPFTLNSGGAPVPAPIVFGGTSTPTYTYYYFSTGSGSGDVWTHLNFASYDGNISIDNVSVTAVPEPESWAMLLVGLTAVGGLARRRKVGQVAG